MRKNGCRAKAPWEDPSFSRLGILWRLFIKGLWFAEATSLSGPKFSTPPPPPPGASSTPAARGKCSPAPIHHQVRCSPPLRPHCAQGPQDLHKDKRHLENRGVPRPELESQFPSLHFASPLCPQRPPHNDRPARLQRGRAPRVGQRGSRSLGFSAIWRRRRNAPLFLRERACARPLVGVQFTGIKGARVGVGERGPGIARTQAGRTWEVPRCRGNPNGRLHVRGLEAGRERMGLLRGEIFPDRLEQRPLQAQQPH